MLSRTAWLASYPKSGNTWVPALLSSLERDGEPSLVTLDPGGRGDRLDSELGVSLGDLSDAEADAMIRTSWANARLASGQFIRRKTHNAWVPGADGFPIPWQPEGARAVYIVRDPRAIAVSFAHHMGFTHETAVAIMASAEWSTSIDRREATSSWSRNVGSWLDD